MQNDIVDKTREKCCAFANMCVALIAVDKMMINCRGQLMCEELQRAEFSGRPIKLIKDIHDKYEIIMDRNMKVLNDFKLLEEIRQESVLFCVNSKNENRGIKVYVLFE
jgi:CheY-like chemotaxis protein